MDPHPQTQSIEHDVDKNKNSWLTVTFEKFLGLLVVVPRQKLFVVDSGNMAVDHVGRGVEFALCIKNETFNE